MRAVDAVPLAAVAISAFKLQGLVVRRARLSTYEVG